ncbi:GntR family transcriptional regulator [Microvirga calopogonii]|uniref:GntR family transcriptional regulator n=1 Tax=Microvirga calopogonii TaxID=2078013 RepID=UPI0013B3D0DC|nr:GntR family transcriptional regulator [Microvirga calopogonii]
MSTKASAQLRRPNLVVYEAIKDILRSKAPDADISISVAAVANHFEISRPPVQRSLNRLVGEGELQISATGKYVRPALRKISSSPEVLSIDSILGDVPDQLLREAQERSSWQKLYTDVERAIVGVLPFGSYKLIESTLAEFYGVSRTVSNQVLLLLEARGFITRGPKGRWRVDQLTQRQLMDIYQLRRLLEPVALLESAPALTPEFIATALRRLDEAESAGGNLHPDELQRLEHDLHVTCLANCLNKPLLIVIEHSQALQIAAMKFPNSSIDEVHRTDYIREHRLVFNALAGGAHDAAAEALVFHLRRSEARASHWLDVAEHIVPPESPTFLSPILS